MSQSVQTGASFETRIRTHLCSTVIFITLSYEARPVASLNSQGGGAQPIYIIHISIYFMSLGEAQSQISHVQGDLPPSPLWLRACMKLVLHYAILTCISRLRVATFCGD